MTEAVQKTIDLQVGDIEATRTKKLKEKELMVMEDYKTGDILLDRKNDREGAVFLKPNPLVRNDQSQLVYGIKFDEIEYIPSVIVNNSLHYKLVKSAPR